MIKGNYGQSYQQSLNEVFASSLHKKQGFSHYTPYFLVNIQVDGGINGIGCMCYDYCSENLESISAWELLQTTKIKQNESYYYPLKDVCISLGMPENVFTDFMDYQIMTDYLLSNTDRHMNNIAILRNPDTLDIIGFAPIYDSGNSMFYNVSYEQLLNYNIVDIKTHSFVEKEVSLLRYVHNRSLVNVDNAFMDFSIYEKDVHERHIRIPLIQKLYEKKIAELRQFQNGRNLWKNDRYKVS